MHEISLTCQGKSLLTYHFHLITAALLQQLLSLTPEQINMLPPEQKQQVLAVQAQMVSEMGQNSTKPLYDQKKSAEFLLMYKVY